MPTKKILTIASVIVALSTAPSYAYSKGNCYLDKNGAPNIVLAFRERLSNFFILTDTKKMTKASYKGLIYTPTMWEYDVLIIEETKKKGRPLTFVEVEDVYLKAFKKARRLEKIFY